jgi:hypothetical protein
MFIIIFISFHFTYNYFKDIFSKKNESIKNIVYDKYKNILNEIDDSLNKNKIIDEETTLPLLPSFNHELDENTITDNQYLEDETNSRNDENERKGKIDKIERKDENDKIDENERNDENERMKPTIETDYNSLSKSSVNLLDDVVKI